MQKDHTKTARFLMICAKSAQGRVVTGEAYRKAANIALAAGAIVFEATQDGFTAEHQERLEMLAREFDITHAGSRGVRHLLGIA